MQSDSEEYLSRPAQEYLSWLAVERGRSANTIAAYRRDLFSFERSMYELHIDPGEAGPVELGEYVQDLAEAGAGRASIARVVSVLHGFYRFLVDESLLDTDPSEALVSPAALQRLPKALSEREVSALLDAASDTGPLGLRDRAILEALYGTGARVSEIVGLDLGDILWDRGLIRLYGKGSKERLVPLGTLARESLDAWSSPWGRGTLQPKQWRRRGDAEAVFLNVRGTRLTRQGVFGIVRRYSLRCGLDERVSPHVLRHSCATHMLAHGADIRVVQELLGHVSIATTQIYTKVSGEHLRAVYEAAHPRAVPTRADLGERGAT